MRLRTFDGIEMMDAGAIGGQLRGIDMDRCDSSGYFADGQDCTKEHPCRIHRIVQALGLPDPRFWTEH